MRFKFVLRLRAVSVNFSCESKTFCLRVLYSGSSLILDSSCASKSHRKNWSGLLAFIPTCYLRSVGSVIGPYRRVSDRSPTSCTAS